jgi:hypothetical protein
MRKNIPLTPFKGGINLIIHFKRRILLFSPSKGEFICFFTIPPLKGAFLHNSPFEGGKGDVKLSVSKEEFCCFHLQRGNKFDYHLQKESLVDITFERGIYLCFSQFPL